MRSVGTAKISAAGHRTIPTLSEQINLWRSRHASDTAVCGGAGRVAVAGGEGRKRTIREGRTGWPPTADQRAAWEKLRRDGLKHQRDGRHVAGFLTDKSGWRMRSYDHFTGDYGWANDGMGQIFTADTAVERAEEATAAPNIKVAVILDVFDDADPKILAWFADDGKGAKQLAGAPTPALERIP